ncbi:MAG: glycosyltransferase family 4 protein [Zoogloeaceae bacterium]|jgi:phosphatidylinositol alpha-1,6-mannosyltransferase|nr:glycosyltransferase family 4 protein [Zoogloeaceae bacterium]
MRRILLISRNFPPLVGGMERLNFHLAEGLARDGELMLIAPEGAASHAPSGAEVLEVPLAPLSLFLLRAAGAALHAARRFHPDVTLAGSGLTAPIAWMAARTCGGVSAAYAHGLDLTAPHPVYRLFWPPALRRVEGIIANSRATARLARNLGIDERRIHLVHPGVTLPSVLPGAEQNLSWRRAHGVPPDAPLLLSVGRLTERKGLKEFVLNVLPRVAARYPKVQLRVIGGAPQHSLYARAQTPEDILAAAKAAGVEDRIHFQGWIIDETLSAWFSAADLHVFPVRELPGDPEGFGMVAIEAAACGLPTVAYATGGVPDAVMEGVSGRLVSPGDDAAFADALCALLARPPDRENLRAFAARFAWPQFQLAIWKALESLSAKT